MRTDGHSVFVTPPPTHKNPALVFLGELICYCTEQHVHKGHKGYSAAALDHQRQSKDPSKITLIACHRSEQWTNNP